MAGEKEVTKKRSKIGFACMILLWGSFMFGILAYYPLHLHDMTPDRIRKQEEVVKEENEPEEGLRVGDDQNIPEENAKEENK